MALNTSFPAAANVAIRIGHENHVWDNNKATLASGVFGPMVNQFLHEIIPDDIPQDALSRINVLVTPRLVLKGPLLLSRFSNKADLISAIMASVHIPMFMDGKPWTSYRGRKYIDGSFWSMVARIKGPWPEKGLNKKVDILHIDYNLDTDFIQSLTDLSIVKLIQPEAVHDMIKCGYAYMEKLDKAGKLPARF